MFCNVVSPQNNDPLTITSWALSDLPNIHRALLSLLGHLTPGLPLKLLKPIMGPPVPNLSLLELPWAL